MSDDIIIIEHLVKQFKALRAVDDVNLRVGRGKVLVIIEFEGAKTALMVDHLIGQYQVVVKNLEANYRKVPGVSGATIMGDGRVALILDVAHVVTAGHSIVVSKPDGQLAH